MTEQFDPPPIAEIPIGVRGGYQPEAGGQKPAVPTIGSGVESPENPEVVAMQRAAATVARYETQRREQADLIEKASIEIKKLVRENELLRLDLLQCQNNLQVAQSQVEQFRQEASDTRALFSSIRAQLDHFEIPLPVRKRARNGGKQHAPPEMESGDRPAIQAIGGA